ncbi:MAG: LysR family transcriptional regulator [Pseudomonadota bacterium]
MLKTATDRDLSLRWLELFQICATKGSLQAAAKETGLSVSTVSHHLRSLEQSLGVELFNHARRPMVLTSKGHAFLRNIEDALYAIRKARAEAAAGSIGDASFLRIGTIEDFDSDITPALAVFLAKAMPDCGFVYQTDTSHAIVEQLRDRQLDLGITASPAERSKDLIDRPLLRDPFIVVSPRAIEAPVEAIVAGETPLPFLRFSRNLMIARQIDAQLRRLGVASPHRFECANNQTLMAMVAAGAGWAITTPLLFARAKRFQPKLGLHRFPGKSFARTLSIVTTPDCSKSVRELVENRVRRLIRDRALSAIHDTAPWLKDSFALID